MPYSIECFLQEALLVLRVRLTQYSQVEKSVQLYFVLI